MNRRLPNLGVALLAGGAGLAVNLLPFSDLVRLWPGRSLTLPVAVLLGPAYGALAAVIGAAAFASQSIWWPIVFGIEAVLFGSASRRQPSPLLTGGLMLAFYAAAFALLPSLSGLPDRSF